MVIRENAPTKVPLSQKISTLYINTYSNMSLYLKTDVPEMLVSIRINTRFGGRDNTSSDNTTYRIRRSISHASGGGFQARLLDNQEGATSANTERYVFGKLSAMFLTPTFAAPILFQLLWRDIYIEHGKSAHGCVVYCTQHSIRYNYHV